MERILQDFEAFKYISAQYEAELQQELSNCQQELELKSSLLAESNLRYNKLQHLAATEIYRLTKHNSLLQSTATQLRSENEKLKSEAEELKLTLESLIIHRETSDTARVSKARRVHREERASKRRKLY
jgi:hypothetical protein